MMENFSVQMPEKKSLLVNTKDAKYFSSSSLYFNGSGGDTSRIPFEAIQGKKSTPESFKGWRCSSDGKYVLSQCRSYMLIKEIQSVTNYFYSDFPLKSKFVE